MNYVSLSDYLKNKYGTKVYKLSLSSGCTCPNRDGTVSFGGCIFCSEGGSGDFAATGMNLDEQISFAKSKVDGKISSKIPIIDRKYIAYFQSFTNTYGDETYLMDLFKHVLDYPEIVGLSIGTRPDCLSDEMIAFLGSLNKEKEVWVELGLQTIHEKSALYIHRGYSLSIYDKAVSELKKREIEVITHVILGLPGESIKDMLDTVKYVCNGRTDGIKLQLLHVLKDTDLEKEYWAGKVTVLSEDEYINILKECAKIIPDNVVVHRLTGDGDKRILVAPLWSGNKKHVLNRLRQNGLV